ncbi:hypothetical protein [Myroides injenensis]|uniref:hypothetical protein n=1 Tax=Myroides injenensis TaxID=1183151 RepID=UPI000289387F|nr:hypothetical protein [Myroides injenensis]
MGKLDQKDSQEFDEINLQYLKESTVSFFDTVGFYFYKVISFIIKKWLIFLIAIILGIGFGYYKSTLNSQYISKLSKNGGYNEITILLAPKFGSIDYLNQLVQNGFNDFSTSEGLVHAELKGVDDIYSYLEEGSTRQKTLSIIASKVDSYTELIENYSTSKGYQYQELVLLAKGDFDCNKFIEELQNYFNNQDYFKKRREIGISSLALKEEELRKDLVYLNNYLSKLDNTVNTTSHKGENAKNSINEVFSMKRKTLRSLEKVEVEKLESNQVIYVVNTFLKDSNSELKKEVISTSPAKQMVKYAIVFSFILLVIFGIKNVFSRYKGM